MSDLGAGSEFDWDFDSRIAPPLGPRVAGYVLGDRIGEGGMGSVYRVRDASGRDLALKLLPANSAEAELKRFEREGRVTASLRHSGIVGVHDAGVADGRAFIVYELVVGRDLEEAFSELERGELLRILGEAAHAVGYAHRQGVIHRDLKPANLLLDERGRVRVADFGVARAANLERMTLSGVLIGTPSHMAPEQITGEQALWGPQIDVWALGVILYRILTGAQPFERAASMAEMAIAITQRAVVAPRAIDPQVSPALEAVCLKALSKQRDDRHPDAEAFAVDLERALAAGPTPRWRGAALAVCVLSLVATAGLFALAAFRVAPPPPDRSPAPEPLDRSARVTAALASARAALARTPSEGTRALERAIERLRRVGGAPELVALRAEIVSAAATAFSGSPEQGLSLLRVLRGVGSPSRSSEETALAQRVFRHALALLDHDPAQTLPWLEALADAELRVGAPLLESEFLSVACLKVSFGGSDAVYWRQLVFASRLDLCAFKTPHFNRKGAVLRDATCPWRQGTQDPWERYVTLRVRLREWERIAATQRELLALLRGPNPSVALGPVHWADTAAELAFTLEGEALWRLLDDAARRDPENPALWHARARKLDESGRTVEAVTAMQRAVELYPARATSQYVAFPIREAYGLLLLFQIKLNQRAEARRTYEHLKRLNPGSAESRAAEHPWLKRSD